MCPFSFLCFGMEIVKGSIITVMGGIMFGIRDIYWVMINSLLSFLFLFIVSKLFGKKQIAQLEFIDYAVGISLGSIAAEWATATDEPFYHYVIAILLYFFLALAVALIGRKTCLLKRIFKGKPIVLIYAGEIVFDGLQKSRIDVNDLLSMLREKGFFDVSDVAYAVFETSGKLSVLPKGNQKPVVIEDIDKGAVKQVSLTNVLVADGLISKSGLREIGKEKSWLFEELGLKDERDLKNIILATYDDANKKINVHYKNRPSK